MLVMLMVGQWGSSGRKKSQLSKHTRSAKEDVSEYEASDKSATKSEEWDTAIEVARLS